ncbi:LTA synthase family protein [Georgenia phoenicis]|uniref:LTA synthase family protein n=1 Tax=unclassified Georgenia TaxID=2626815 RepID=UPI0039AF919D
MTSTSPRHALPRTAPRILRYVLRFVVLPLAVTVLLAVAVARGVELVHAQTSYPVTPQERWEALPPQVHVLGALTVWPFVALLLAVTGSMWATAILTLAAGALIAVADYQKMVHRSEPLFPSDIEYLRSARMLLESAGISPALAVGAVVVVLLGLAAVAVLAWRRRGRRGNEARWFRWGSRLALGAAGIAGVVVISGFNSPDNPLRQAYEDVPVTWAPWNQVQNYAQNGFVAGALYNVPGPAMERPEGYGEERMEELVATYEQVAAELNATREDGALEDTNVLIVLSETFSDPTWLEGVEVAEDPIPFTRSLMEENPSGRMLARGVGGGTATVEFEVLTGMAVTNFQPQVSSPFPQVVPHHPQFPSIASSLSETHGALAIHPYAAGFYRRDIVYPRLGFDRATFREDMAHRETIESGPYISDAATYREVLDELRASSDPLVVNVVTMQNHTPHVGSYPDPIDVSGPFGEEDAEKLGHYLRGLRHSDEALADLLAELESLEERTVVLFYGDHLSATLPESVRTANEEQRLRETPWFVWSSFGTADVQAPPLLTPNLLLTQLLAAVDAPLSPYAALLTELSQEVAGHQRGALLDGQGRPVSEEDLSPRARELLADYRLAQYDLSVGERYAEEALLAMP